MGNCLWGEQMSDDADRADQRIEESVSDAIAKAHRIAAAIPEGNPGECDGCGEWSGRIVEGYCSPCRDRYARFFK